VRYHRPNTIQYNNTYPLLAPVILLRHRAAIIIYYCMGQAHCKMAAHVQ